jgi:hypothetical protein
MADALIADPDVPGLVRPSAKVVRDVRIGTWRFQMLKDGTMFMSHWAGADNERMVSHELFSAEDAAKIAGVFT